MPRSAEGEYSAAWADYRRRARMFWFVFLTYLPGVLFLSRGVGAVFGIEQPFFEVAIVWMAAFALAGWYRNGWRCPRCGQPFFYRRFWKNDFARRCLHCGLPKWAVEDQRASA